MAIARGARLAEVVQGVPRRALFSGRVAIVVLGGLALAAILALLLTTAEMSIRVGHSNAYTLQNFKDVYLDGFAYKSLLNTFGFAGLSLLTALVFGVPIAWLAERSDLPGRGAIFPLMTVSILVPGFFAAMGWLFLLHPRIGMVNRGLMDLFGLADPVFNVVSLPGMGFVQGLGLSSLIFIMSAASFRAMDPALEESAQIHGVTFLRRLRLVTLPLVWPGILAAGIFVFMVGLAVFDVPAVIGLANRIFTYSTFVYSLVNPIQGTPNYGLAAASSVIMVLIALLLSWWYLRVVRRSHRYQIVTGRGYRPKPVELGRWGAIAGWTFIGVKSLLSLVLPGLVLIWASLLPFFEPFSFDAVSRVSLANYREIPWDGFWIAVRNSVIVVLAAPTLTTIFALAISWVVVRSRLKFARIYDTLAFLPLAVPSLVFAIGALVLGLFWFPDFLPFYGTVVILIFVDVIVLISFATRVFNGALLQVHRELDEAGYVFGLKPVAVVWKILRPLVAPAILYAWVWMALLAYRELTVASLLVTRANITLPVFVWGIWSNGSLGQAAAITILLITFMLPLVIAYFIFGRQRLALGS